MPAPGWSAEWAARGADEVGALFRLNKDRDGVNAKRFGEHRRGGAQGVEQRCSSAGSLNRAVKVI